VFVPKITFSKNVILAFVTVNDEDGVLEGVAEEFEGTTLAVAGITLWNGALEGVAEEFEGTTLAVIGLPRLSNCA
jgi:hypothetical protein